MIIERSIRRSKPKAKCPRCRSMRVDKRLDGSRFCNRCGQRIAKDGRLIPSNDRRGIEDDKPTQLNLL